MKTYVSRHFQVLFATLGDMRRTPIASLSTIAIIGISLLLPALLYIIVKSGDQLSHDWQGQPQFSVFLQQDLQSDEAQLIFEELRLHPAVQLAEFITPDAALKEFEALSGLEFELSLLDQNPLPASIVVLPGEQYHSTDELQQLRTELAKIDGIEEIRMDLEWTDRFNAILAYLSQAALIVSVFLGVALILVIGTTIKLLILNRSQEIEITKLVGGSNSFVRRPFLYFGLYFGVFGALLAIGLLQLIATMMATATTELAGLYGRSTLLYQIGWQEVSSLILGGGLLGWLAARLSVAQHLGRIKPR